MNPSKKLSIAALDAAKAAVGELCPHCAEDRTHRIEDNNDRLTAAQLADFSEWYDITFLCTTCGEQWDREEQVEIYQREVQQ
jgi:transposase-like protein